MMMDDDNPLERELARLRSEQEARTAAEAAEAENAETARVGDDLEAEAVQDDEAILMPDPQPAPAATSVASDARLAAESFEEEMLVPLSIKPQRSLEEEIIFSASGNHEPLPMLEVIFKRMAGAYSPMLKTQNGLLSECNLHDLVYGSWEHAIADMPAESTAVIANASWGGPIMIGLDPALLHASMAVMLGGDAGRDVPPKRAPTMLERAFAQRLFKQAADELALHMSRLAEVSFTLEAVENPAQISSLLAGNASVVTGDLTITIGSVEGHLTFVLPLETLEPARAQLGKMFLGEKLGADTSWRDHFAGHISGATMQVEVELARVEVPLADILQWRPGVTVDLGVMLEQEAVMRCSGIPILHGATGRKRNGRMALKVTREHGEDVERTDDGLLDD